MCWACSQHTVRHMAGGRGRTHTRHSSKNQPATCKNAQESTAAHGPNTLAPATLHGRRASSQLYSTNRAIKFASRHVAAPAPKTVALQIEQYDLLLARCGAQQRMQHNGCCLLLHMLVQAEMAAAQDSSWNPALGPSAILCLHLLGPMLPAYCAALLEMQPRKQHVG